MKTRKPDFVVSLGDLGESKDCTEYGRGAGFVDVAGAERRRCACTGRGVSTPVEASSGTRVEEPARRVEDARRLHHARRLVQRRLRRRGRREE